jgi:membrane-associated phospholipid phosphatase
LYSRAVVLNGAIALRTAAVAATLFVAACGEDSPRQEVARADPAAGSWDTWVLAAPSQVRVPPPPAPGSRPAIADAAAVRTRARNRSANARARIRAWGARPDVDPWLRMAMRLVSARAKDPPASSRAYALLSVAMYDATVAAWHWKQVYRRHAPTEVRVIGPRSEQPSFPDDRAAIAGAAARVLSHLYPEAGAARLEAMARDAAASRVDAGTAYPTDAQAGLALGRKVGAAVVAYARRDGFARKWDGRRPRGRGLWEPPPGSVAKPVQPLAGHWRTWVLSSGAELRPEAPPRFGSPRYVAEARELIAMRRDLTPAEAGSAHFWAGGEGTPLPAGIWNEAVLADVAHRDLSTPRAARVLALVNVAMADAGIAAWDAKFKYWTPRPENAIRDLGLESDWKPLLQTPFFPGYVSGHAVYSGAASEVLAYLFPDEAERFRARAREAATSRLLGGIHFRSDSVVGLRMGRDLGRMVVARARLDGADR